jgi:hypothetical protein
MQTDSYRQSSQDLALDQQDPALYQQNPAVDQQDPALYQQDRAIDPQEPGQPDRRWLLRDSSAWPRVSCNHWTAFDLGKSDSDSFFTRSGQWPWLAPDFEPDE